MKNPHLPQQRQSPRQPRNTTTARRLGRWLAVLTAAALAVLTTGAPAQAGSGTGTAFFWTYFNPADFAFHGTVPGVQAFANGVDTNGSRSLQITVKDTAADDRCANVRIDVDGIGTTAQKQVCGNGTQKTVSMPAATGGMLITIFRTVPGQTTADRSVLMSIPDTAVDAGLRAAGTIVSLSYTTATAFEYEMRRPGVRLEGGGMNTGADKVVDGELTNTAGLGTCAMAKSFTSAPPVQESVCSSGPVDTFSSTFSVNDGLQACQFVSATVTTRCINIFLPTT